MFAHAWSSARVSEREFILWFIGGESIVGFFPLEVVPVVYSMLYE